MKRQGNRRMTVAWLVTVVGILAGGTIAARAEIIMSEPTNLGPVINDAYNVQECDLSRDGLELYFAEWDRPGGFGSGDIWVAKRETVDSSWQEPVNLGPNVNSSGGEIEPSISSDGLELYFGCWDDYILRVCTRPSKDAPWSSPAKIGPPVGAVDTAIEVGSDDAWSPEISADGLSLYFSSTRGGGHGGTDIWVAKRAAKDDPWGEPVSLGPNVNSGSDDWSPSISADGLTLVFSRGFGSIWAATRESADADWGPAVKLGFNPPPVQWNQFFGAALSPDGSTLYFRASLGWGGYGLGDFWQVEFVPIVDFDGDGLVDIDDLVMLIEHWGEENSLYDVGPLPLGDGVVDEADLRVFMSHWGQEAYDPALLAHWKLDEMGDNLAHDGAGADHDGTVMGAARWQPEGGQVKGALDFDGATCVVAPYVLSPADGPFSVFAWVKGGGPGQGIISQADGADWLRAAASTGTLMTSLSQPAGRSTALPLVSETTITDGKWHRIGFVWGGTQRQLYVDDVLVAEDTQNGLATSSGKLLIGCGRDMAAGTFWTGLIDDVRIYNRAVKP
jgi:hypothetical protein